MNATEDTAAQTRTARTPGPIADRGPQRMPPEHELPEDIEWDIGPDAAHWSPGLARAADDPTVEQAAEAPWTEHEHEPEIDEAEIDEAEWDEEPER